ncbi:FAD-binding oxidoreductase, partial [Pantoea sp.]|uniref:NAD(P)/FAD-dependent oxidoreductase n=1 Tax=Pantoea sp. TaxID=69393 RepID=UPI0028A5EC7A
ELADIDAPATPVQLKAVEQVARQLVPLGAAVEAEPWKGARPCMPDMKPVIGAVPGQPGMWCAFGHGHQGFTLGPATGMLLAELMHGEHSSIAMEAFSPARRF